MYVRYINYSVKINGLPIIVDNKMIIIHIKNYIVVCRY